MACCALEIIELAESMRSCRLWAGVLFLLLALGCSPPKNAPQSGAEPLSPGDLASIGSKLDLNLCNIRVSNPPDSIAGRVLRQSARACLNDVQLLVAPAPGACLTSGYGQRGSRLHRGIDYQSLPAGRVVAAGNGVIVEKGFRSKDFGNWLVIGHGAGVYSAYGHLASFRPGLFKGKSLRQGEHVGVMGSTGNATRAVHLHFEVRQGQIPAVGNFFSLESVDPFALPAQCG